MIIPAHSDWCQTRSGRAFDFQQPSAAMVSASDVAYAIGCMPRFAGHTAHHYSVAQHSLAVAELLAFWGEPVAVQLQGLVHDAHEAYVMDLPSPLKRLLPEYQQIEAQVWTAVAEYFQVPEELDAAVKRADASILGSEAHQLLEGGPRWTPPVRAGCAEAERIVALQMTPTEAAQRWLMKLGEILVDLQFGRVTLA